MAVLDQLQDDFTAALVARQGLDKVQQVGSALDTMSFDLSTKYDKKPYVPFVKGDKLAPPWANNFLDKLLDNGGFISKAATAADMVRSTVWAAQQRLPAFAEQVEKIKEYWRDIHLDELEALSITQALKPGNITERILQLKQHSPRYRDRGKNEEPTKIHVTVGINIPKPDYAQVATDAVVE